MADGSGDAAAAGSTMVSLPYTEPRRGRGRDEADGVAVHPASIDRLRTHSIDRLQPGHPTAPEGGRLPLLPSGPDGVHGLSLRGTRLSTSVDVVGDEGGSASAGDSVPL